MDWTAARALVHDITANTLGVETVITTPGGVPFSARAIGWLPPVDEEMPVGRDFQRREPRRVLAFRRVDEYGALPDIPRGTLIEATEYGGEARTWQVDGYDLQNAEQVRLIVKAVA